MKPITFENLRRLIGGRRKNKDRNESPFKRSESFKRISIRRNYLESRGGGGSGQKGRNPTKKPPPIEDDDVHRVSSCETAKTTTSCTSLPAVVPPVATAASPPPPLPPAVGPPPSCPLPEPPKDDNVVAAAAVERKRRTVASPVPPQLPPPNAAPVIDYGEWIRCIRIEEDLNNIKRSCSPPTPPARYRYHKELDDSSRTDSAISLGRIWMDAPMLPPAAPRSLELPGRPVATTDNDGQQRRAHHSLESALKDKRDDRPVPCRRFHRYPVDKAASRSSVASTCSGKDSGFSLSAPGLSDPPHPPKQLLRKKAPRQRTAASAAASKLLPPCTSPASAQQDQLYQVVVARSPLRQLKLDPMMFVPPEKRRPGKSSSGQHQHANNKCPNPKPRPVVEVRDYCVPKDARLQHQRCDDDNYTDDYDEQDRLYESISKGRGRWQESTDDADTEDDAHLQHRTCVAARNRVKRKKSARRNIKYVVKPVRRAPSAATRKPSVTAKSKPSWITSTS